MVVAQHQIFPGAQIDGDNSLNISGSGSKGTSTTSNGQCCVVMGIDQLDKLRDFGCLGGSESATRLQCSFMGIVV